MSGRLRPQPPVRHDDESQRALVRGQANDASTDPAIGTDGMKVVFFSTASFVADDTNTCPPFFFSHPGACPDIYLHTN